MASYLRPRRGRKATAESQNILLKRGEVFFEVPTSGVGTGIGKVKVGDGTTGYSSLPYFIDQGNVTDSSVNFTESSVTDNTELLNKITTGSKLNVIVPSMKKIISNLNNKVNNNCSINLNLSELSTIDKSYIYVSPNGSDTSGNGSSSKPYRSISRAIKDIPDSMYANGANGTNYDTKKQIRVEGGTYNESIYVIGKEFKICLAGDVTINATTNTTFNLSRGSKVSVTTLNESSATTKYSLTLNCLGTAEDSIAVYVESSSILRFIHLKNIVIENSKSYIFYSYTDSVIEAHITCDNLQINNSCASTYDCALFGAVFSASIMINCNSLTIQSSVGKTRFAIASIDSFIGFVVKNGIDINSNFTYALVSYYCSRICIFSSYPWVDNSLYKNSTDYGGEIKIGRQNDNLLTINLKSENNTIAANSTKLITIDTTNVMNNYIVNSIAGWYITDDKCTVVYIRPINNNNAVEILLKNTSSASITVSVTVNLAIKRIS